MWIKNESGKLKWYNELPKYYKHWAGGFDKESQQVHNSEGFYELITPNFDLNLQDLGEIYFDEVNQQYTYAVIDKTQEQIEAEMESHLEALDTQINFQSVKRLLQKVAEPVLTDEANLTEQDIEDAKTLYKQYRVGVIYDKDSSNIDEKRFVWNGDLYKVIGAKHTSQADWTPDTAVSLYVKITPPGVIAPWSQPTGAHDVYAMGDKVTHNGQTWESTANDNVWEPGVYGWVVI